MSDDNDPVFKPLCICVIGMESSGSTLITHVIANVLDIAKFRTVRLNHDGYPEDKRGDIIFHHSLPATQRSLWLDVDAFLKKWSPTHEVRFVICTRDRTISELSRLRRWRWKQQEQIEPESTHAINIMQYVLRLDVPTYIHSYETFMLLGKFALQPLYAFLDVKSHFCPPLVDGNLKYIDI